MKLPIKHKYFLEIKEGRKTMEIRDAHITFVDEETNETIVKQIWTVGIGMKKEILELGNLSEEEGKELFTDDTLVYFVWD